MSKKITFEDGMPRMSDMFFRKYLRSDTQNLYCTRYLNDCLYLHFYGFKKIENLEKFTGLKVLYLEGNGFLKIEGLEQCTQIVSLFLHENCIEKIENLEANIAIRNLVLNINCIQKIENLSHLKLKTLDLRSNYVGKGGIDDLIDLVNMPHLEILNLTGNKIEDPNVFDEVFAKMKSLRVLYLCRNPVIKKIKSYRKTVINKIKQLTYLDDRPVFKDDRRFAEAWMRGGFEEERKEREKCKQEKEDKRVREHREFKEMVDQWNVQKEEEDRVAREQQLSELLGEDYDPNEEEKKEEDVQNNNDNTSQSDSRSQTSQTNSQSNSQTLETYYTENTNSSKETSEIDSQKNNSEIGEQEEIPFERDDDSVEELNDQNKDDQIFNEDDLIPDLEDADSEEEKEQVNYLDELE